MDADSLAQIREIVVESVAEVKRHNGVLIENFRQKLDLVVEGQQNISRQSEATRALHACRTSDSNSGWRALSAGVPSPASQP